MFILLGIWSFLLTGKMQKLLVHVVSEVPKASRPVEFRCLASIEKADDDN